MRRHIMQLRGSNCFFWVERGGQFQRNFQFLLCSQCVLTMFYQVPIRFHNFLMCLNPFPITPHFFGGMLWQMLSSFTYTSVACAIGPSVNPLQNRMNSTYEQYFARYLVWPMPLAQSVNGVF
jgi:hypothetical protein